jgi:hypothetical protein
MYGNTRNSIGQHVDTGPLTVSDSMLWILGPDSIGQYIVDIGPLRVSDRTLRILGHNQYWTVYCGYWATDSIGQYVVDTGPQTVSDSMLWILGH